MAKQLPKEVVNLIDYYKKTQANLVDIIAKNLNGEDAGYRKKMLDSVNIELEKLNNYCTDWANDVIPKSYQTGIDNTYAWYRRQDLDITKAVVNQKVVDTMVENVYGQLTDANNFVGRRIRDEVRQAGIEAVAQKIGTGSTVKQTKELLLEKFSKKGIINITDKAGRTINLESYASMVARTTTREATNKGSIYATQEAGSDLVKIPSHFSSCPICIPYEGRVYSISGKDKRYPPLSEPFSDGYATIHPNCTHSTVPYIEKFDDDAEQMRTDSNKPFTVPPEKQKSLDAYNKSQAAKTSRRNDYNKWEKAKIENPSDTPKTFTKFRKTLNA